MATSEATLAAARELIELSKVAQETKCAPDRYFYSRHADDHAAAMAAALLAAKVAQETKCAPDRYFYSRHADDHAAAIAEALLAADAENARLRAAMQLVIDKLLPCHVDGCPEDDTCDCYAKPFHDAINEAMRKDGGK